MEGNDGWAMAYYDSIVNRDITRLDWLVDNYEIDVNEKFSEARKKTDLDLSPIHLVCYLGFSGTDAVTAG